MEDEFLVGYLRIVSASEYPFGAVRDKHHPHLPLSEVCLGQVAVEDELLVGYLRIVSAS